mmetsp:Transcript_15104/g.20844  ORF Transcript_15104/g.20844 Transcript_15104/m.20844 type:complete len:204 (+) Transcript_15104:85-696(+)
MSSVYRNITLNACLPNSGHISNIFVKRMNSCRSLKPQLKSPIQLHPSNLKSYKFRKNLVTCAQSKVGGGLLGNLFGKGKQENEFGELEGKVIEVKSEADFDSLVEKHPNHLVILNCSLTACGPCKLLYPSYELFAENYTDCIFGYCVGDENESTKALFSRLNVSTVPAFQFYRNGEMEWQYVGSNKKMLRETILSKLLPGETR